VSVALAFPARETQETTLFNAIVRAAKERRRCPTNVEMAALLEVASPATPVRILARLSRAGKIAVYSGQCQRVVDIPSLGIGTAGSLPARHWRENNGQTLVTHLRGEAPEPERYAAAKSVRSMSDAEISARAVNRDPCIMCGVRGDIGCKHKGPHHAS